MLPAPPRQTAARHLSRHDDHPQRSQALRSSLRRHQKTAITSPCTLLCCSRTAERAPESMNLLAPESLRPAQSSRAASSPRHSRSLEASAKTASRVSHSTLSHAASSTCVFSTPGHGWLCSGSDLRKTVLSSSTAGPRISQMMCGNDYSSSHIKTVQYYTSSPRYMVDSLYLRTFVQYLSDESAPDQAEVTNLTQSHWAKFCDFWA